MYYQWEDAPALLNGMSLAVTKLFCSESVGSAFSADENLRRCKPSHEGWVTNRYPLRELG